jgi:methylated-DNA-[protein]-cysteine S-methyltransferase
MIKVYSKMINGVWFGVACSKNQIFGCSFDKTQRQVLKNLINGLPLNMPFQALFEPSQFGEKVLLFLSYIYEGKAVTVDFLLFINHLPAYTMCVLKLVMQIPIGYVASYNSIAEAVGGSARAVGNVMAHNPFLLIIPCHRIVKSDFTLGGYRSGLNFKKRFLMLEKRGFSGSKEIEVEGKRVQVYPVELVLMA